MLMKLKLILKMLLIETILALEITTNQNVIKESVWSLTRGYRLVTCRRRIT